MWALEAEIVLPGLVWAAEFTGRPQEADRSREAGTQRKEAEAISETKGAERRGRACVNTSPPAEVKDMLFPPQLCDFSCQVPGFELSAFFTE